MKTTPRLHPDSRAVSRPVLPGPGGSRYASATKDSHIQYEEGSLDYLKPLDSQRAQYQAEAAVIDSQLAITQSYIALNKALGGGWTGENSADVIASQR